MTLKATPLLGRAETTIGANRIRERDDLALVSVATPLDGDAALSAAMQAGFSIAMPQPTLSTQSGEMRAVQTASDQVMLVFPHATPDANAVVQDKLGGTGYTTDQTDNWVVLEVQGPDTLAALERICALDLHDAAFPPGSSGRTVMEHMGALILRLDQDRFWLMAASSYAQSFLHAVETSYRNVVD